MIDMNTLFKIAMEKNASDLHITANSPPVLRIDGKLHFLDMRPLTGEETKTLIYSILTDEQKAIFEKDKELDFSFSMPGLDRFRVNVHYQKGNVEAAFRRIPFRIPSLEELGVPLVAYDFLMLLLWERCVI